MKPILIDNIFSLKQLNLMRKWQPEETYYRLIDLENKSRVKEEKLNVSVSLNIFTYDLLT